MSLEERAVQARAVEHGHPKVAEHEIVLAHGDSIDGLLAVEHDLRFEAPLTKDLAERFGDLMFVLDHQNSQAEHEIAETLSEILRQRGFETEDLAERFGDLMFVLDHQNSQAGPGFILSRIAFG